MILMLGLSAENVTNFVVKGLAVAGAFLVGFALMGLVAIALDRWLFNKKTPVGMKRVARILGGLAAAFLAALILFGEGGSGLFGGAAGTGNGKPKGATPTNPAELNVSTPTPPSPVVSEVPADNAVIRVMILGGFDVKDGRFYKLDDDATPKTFEDAKKAIVARQTSDSKKLAIVLLFPAQNAPARDHPAVIQLERWAMDEARIGVFQPAKQ